MITKLPTQSQLQFWPLAKLWINLFGPDRLGSQNHDGWFSLLQPRGHGRGPQLSIVLPDLLSHSGHDFSPNDSKKRTDIGCNLYSLRSEWQSNREWRFVRFVLEDVFAFLHSPRHVASLRVQERENDECCANKWSNKKKGNLIQKMTERVVGN